MKTKREDYSKATCLAVTGTPAQVSSGWPSEVCSTNSQLPSPTRRTKLHRMRKTLKIASWSVRPLLKPETPLLADDLERTEIDITFLQKTRLHGGSSRTLYITKVEPAYNIFYSGYEENEGMHGVGIAIRNRLEDKVMKWNAHGPRLCHLRIH